MRHVAQAPSHYEVELRQAGHRDEQAGNGWRAIRRVGPDGAMAPLTFATLAAAQTYAKRMNPGQARIVAVEHGGWRRMVDAAET
jgi:hypothetical protein